MVTAVDQVASGIYSDLRLIGLYTEGHGVYDLNISQLFTVTFC